MGSIKLKIHPLFILFGIYYAFTKRTLTFLVCSLSALIHELGHSIVAGDRGYRLNKIVLMPFGAVVKGDFSHPNFADDILISIAGPITNLIIVLIFTALWWVYPLSYPYTFLAVEMNLSMALINLIPAFPLDGGRVLSAILSVKFSSKVADTVCKTTGIVLSFILFALFIISSFYTINFSILFFSLFIFFGVITKEKENVYVRFFEGVSKQKLKLGVSVKRFAIDKNSTIKRLLQILDCECLNEVVVYDEKSPICTLSQEKIAKIVQERGIMEKIIDCI